MKVAKKREKREKSKGAPLQAIIIIVVHNIRGVDIRGSIKLAEEGINSKEEEEEEIKLLLFLSTQQVCP